MSSDMNESRRVRQLDEQIQRVSASTRTSIPAFTPLHNWLRSRSVFYYRWHTNEIASAVHVAILIITLFFTGVIGVSLVGISFIFGIFYYFK